MGIFFTTLEINNDFLSSKGLFMQHQTAKKVAKNFIFPTYYFFTIWCNAFPQVKNKTTTFPQVNLYKKRRVGQFDNGESFVTHMRTPLPVSGAPL